jgi:hypothetical protein
VDYGHVATCAASYADDVVVGEGRGVERPNVNEFFPHGVDRTIVVIYYGAGARIRIHRGLDAFEQQSRNPNANAAPSLAGSRAPQLAPSTSPARR